MTTWSYSGIKTFDQCPRKYYHLKVACDVKDPGGTAAIYGTQVHKAAEEYIRDGKPIPAKFSFVAPVVEVLNQFVGDKHCEIKLAVRKTDGGYEPCEFDSPEAWWRGIADLLILNGDKATVIDYKTGKNTRYADVKQLDLLAAGVFTHYPEVMRIKSALAYVVTNDLIRKHHVRDLRGEYFSVFDNELERLAACHENGVWNAKTGPLCRFCPVTKCEHNPKW